MGEKKNEVGEDRQTEIFNSALPGCRQIFKSSQLFPVLLLKQAYAPHINLSC